MKILLMSPPFSKLFGLKNIYNHLGLLYLAAVLRDNNYEVSVYNSDFATPRTQTALNWATNFHKYKKNLHDPKFYVWKEVAKVIEKVSPDIIGLSVNTPGYMSALNVAKIAKGIDKKIIVVVGGPHPTVLPRETVSEPYFDIVVRSEGERTFLELVNVIKNGGKKHKVKGITYKEKGKIVSTPNRTLIKNLCELPLPARDLVIDNKKYPPYAFGFMMTARGCPFNCSFCESKIIWRRKVRFRTPEHVVKEIEHVYENYGTREFAFNDDTFTINKKYVSEICKLIISKRLDIIWYCQTRCDLIDEKTLKIMKNAGCESIQFGIESGNQEILKSISKGITLDQIRKSVKMTKKEGIRAGAGFMLGHLRDTKKTVEETAKFLKSLDLDFGTVSITVPHPGSDIYYQVLKEKRLLTRKWEDYITCNPNIIRYKDITPEFLYNVYIDLLKHHRKSSRRFTIAQRLDLNYIQKKICEFKMNPKYYIKRFIRV